MVLTLFECVYQVAGIGKAESNYEEEKKSAKYRRTKYIMKLTIGGERLQLVRGLVFQKKICNLWFLI